MPLANGTLLGRYEVRRLLGTGGMGEVYLAHDSQLRRPVALKLLPAQFAQDESRLRRFRQEAYAIAALSHPNIAHVYEIGEEGNANFIVMEFVDGETLRTRIHRDKSELNKLLQYLIQVADGLAKAHSVGIVHRDLKPDNIMITQEGYAKILDFGLAKLLRPEPSPGSISGDLSDIPTVMLPHQSAQGVVMGTVGYMSPEQVRALQVDHRSDIFSFGCILYEAITKQMAFRGDSDVDTLHRILYAEASPISEYNPTPPAELQRILRRCLAKDPEQRYQTIKDVAIELRELLSQTQEAGYAPAAEVTANKVSTSTATDTFEGKTTVVSGIRKVPSAVFVVGAVLVAVILAAYYFFSNRNRTHTFTPPQQELISTFPGSHRSASLSPDGKSIAFINDVNGVSQVWTKNLTEGAAKQITFGPERAARPRWSPIGDQVAYELRSGGVTSIWSVKPEGGDPKKLIEGGRNANWSWDGKRLVFERGYDIGTAKADGSDQRRVEGVPNTDLLLADRSPAFSPDGKLIVFFEKDKGPIGDFWVIPSTGGQPRRLTFDNTMGGTPSFTPDGKFIVFSSLRAGSRTLWKVPVDGGQPEPVLVSAGEDTEPEISRDGRQLIYTNTRNQFELTITDPVSGESKTLKDSRVDMVDPSFSPDGNKIVFFEVAGDGDIQLFVVKPDGTDLTQVTHGKTERNIHPQWSADGSALYFYQISPQLSFRKIKIGDEQSTEVVAGWEWGTQNGARVNPEGTRALYVQLDKGRAVATMMRDLRTGSESAFPLLRHPRWSPDGHFVIGTSVPSDRSTQDVVVICPSDGGECRNLAPGFYPHWFGNSRIYFMRDSKRSDGEEVWTMSLAGGDEKQVTDLYPLHPIGQFFDVSPTGQIIWIKYERGRNELWLAKLAAL